jgi:tetratricopeptide (TPR) repeat protein
MRAGAPSQPAYELVLRARRLEDEARALSIDPTAPDVHAAIATLSQADSLLERAGRLDDQWARVWIERAWIAHARGQLHAAAARAAELDRGLQLAEHAIRLSDSPEAYEVRGVLRFARSRVYGQGDALAGGFADAERDLRHALEGNPRLARSWATLSFMQWMRGSFREAAISGARALEEDAFLDDAPQVLSRLFYVSAMLGDIPAARSWCERGFRTVPGDWRFTECRLTTLLYDTKGPQRPAYAWALVDTMRMIDPADKAAEAGHPYSPIFRMLAAAAVSARVGDARRARAALSESAALAGTDSALTTNRLPDAAYVLWVLGARDSASALLRLHIARRPLAEHLLERDPLLRPILMHAPQ